VPVFETEEKFCPLFSSLKRKRPPYDGNEQDSNELHSIFKKSTPHLHGSSTKYKLTRPRVERFQYLSNTVYNSVASAGRALLISMYSAIIFNNMSPLPKAHKP
jgi:hypothetical protein